MEFIAFVVSPRFQEQAFYEQGSLPVSKQAINEILSNSSLPAYEREWMEAVLRLINQATLARSSMAYTLALTRND